ncbi:MAG: hypothetical protein M1269_12720 [Chloroflexi bacterium]|nr:hypothetical protein [Chloroflexota bacterium]
MNLELAGNPGVYMVKAYSRYEIQALTPEPPECAGTFQTASKTNREALIDPDK